MAKPNSLKLVRNFEANLYILKEDEGGFNFIILIISKAEKSLLLVDIDHKLLLELQMLLLKLYSKKEK